mmetsp:Transcript_11663/g.23707  ORF Transcript_11663/g.23707 Transcript_11663/m.23707 type:complete len:519 (+) Transcript_11663:133-1689(+)
METKRMQETFEDIHHQQDTERDTGKDTVTNKGSEPVDTQSGKHGLLPKDSRKFRVGKRKSPETKVRRRVGYHTEDEFNGFDSLVNNNFSKAVFFIVVSFVVVFSVVNGLMRLLRKEVWFGKQQDGDRDKGAQKQDVLDRSLPSVHGFVNNTWVQGNIDQGCNQVGWLATIARTAKVKRTLGCSIVNYTIHTTRVAPWSAGSIAFIRAIGPVNILIDSPILALIFQARGHEHAGIPVNTPLVKDQKDHVKKHRRRKDDHRNEFKHKVERFFEIDGIDSFEAGTHKHLDDSKDDRELHLERVKEQQFIRRHMPNGIETKGINRTFIAIWVHEFGFVTTFNFAGVLAVKLIARTKQVETKRETIIVHESSVNGKETHHSNHVTTTMHAFREFIELGIFVLLFVPNKVKTGEEQEKTVTNITVHDPKKERESSGRKEGGVRLAITRNTVGVDKFLVPIGELVRDKVSGRSRPWLGNLIHQRWHGEIHVGVCAFNRFANSIEGFGNDPTFATKHTGNIRLEHV